MQSTAAACDTSCDNSSFTDELDCEQQAESGVCASYVASAQTCSAQLHIATVLCVGRN